MHIDKVGSNLLCFSVQRCIALDWKEPVGHLTPILELIRLTELQ